MIALERDALASIKGVSETRYVIHGNLTPDEKGCQHVYLHSTATSETGVIVMEAYLLSSTCYLIRDNENCR